MTASRQIPPIFPKWNRRRNETGYTNVVVWPSIAEKQRRVLLQSRLMEVRGTVQKESGVLHLIAKQLNDLSPWLQGMAMRSRDFH